MKKVRFALAMALMLFMLSGCSGYVNSYFATILSTSCQGDEASMEFASFNGTYNFKLTGEKNGDHTLDYDVSLDKGEMKVYVGVGGEKKFLFTVKGGEPHNGTSALGAEYDNKKTVYIILESVGECRNGDFEFDYN